MQRRGGSSKPVRGQRTTELKARKAQTADELLDQRTRERDEALEQLAATSGVLRVVSRSTFDLQAVFDTLVESAARLCRADRASIRLGRDGFFHHVANYGYTAEQHQYMNEHPIPAKPDQGSVVGRVLSAGKTVQIEDTKADPEFRVTNVPGFENVHTTLGVPLLREGKPIGMLVLMRGFVEAFTDKQIELVETFAAQAVIAIENTHLLNELRESLQQQTATADVLKVISRSTFDLQSVFKALVDSAAQLCRAKMANIALLKEDGFEYHAAYGFEPDYMAYVRSHNLKADRWSVIGRAALEARIVHIHDVLVDSEYTSGPGNRWRLDAQKRSGFRTVLGVPLLREGEPIGAMFLSRDTVEPFTQQQIDLVTIFAAQAVIAIENTRLVNELRESLQQQTATAEVLKVIAGSSGELTPVFEAMLENAVRICDAKFGNLFLYADNSFRIAAQSDAPPTYAERWRKRPVLMVGDNPHNPLDRLAASKSVVNIPDLMTEPGYIERDPRFVALVEAAGARTHLAVPMLKDNELVGAISIFRQDVCPFTSKQIELVQNFASQAVIAIENARLLNDLNKLNQQLEQRVADQVSEIERMSRLRRFLPPQVADLIVASGTEKQLESHRREITALFCDLRGFTGFSESSDPEDVMALLREYHAAIGAIINTYGGTLEH